jgi:hypothetical protein
VQGLTTVLDSAGTALARRSTIQFSTGLVAVDDGSKTVVTATGAGAVGSDGVTNESGVAGATVSAALDQLAADANALPQYAYGDTSFSPIVLFNGDTGAADQSGSGLNITAGVANSFGLVDAFTGQKCLYIAAGASMAVAVSAALRITGDVTCIWMGALEDEPGSNFNYFACGGAAGSELEAENLLYRLNHTLSSNRPRVLRASWEHSVGTNVDVDSDAANGGISLPKRGQMHQVAMVRDGTTCRMYINGELVQTATSLTIPTGGGNAQLLLGANGPGATTVASHLVFSFQVIGSALSTAQILAEYNRTMGPVHGVKS